MSLVNQFQSQRIFLAILAYELKLSKSDQTLSFVLVISSCEPVSTVGNTFPVLKFRSET